jgi:NDP-sugar pyrophosphorylase family protein
MKNIVIAAGYATRLGELTKNFPKPLLKIGENTILGRMLDDIDRIPEIDEHIIITNHKFAHIFEDWAHGETLPVMSTEVETSLEISRQARDDRGADSGVPWHGCAARYLSPGRG